ncbi:MAG: OmpA family protein, partial [Candidatus Krumholzibacteriota bacterium]|nr:OmpA family protein [Candidatus Krumholzibacteriota bacterium]
MKKRKNNLYPDRQRTVSGFLLSASLFVFLAAAGTSSFAAIPPAGQVITGQSTATYELGGNGYVAQSNIVSLNVLALFGPGLLPDGSVLNPAATASAFSTEPVTFPFLLTNNGNAGDIFDLAARVVNPSDFIPALTEVYLDIDGDSTLDVGEGVISQVGPLSPGQTAALILRAVLPPGLFGSETAHLDLEARSRGDTALVDRGNVVRITARNEANVSLVLQADRPAVLPGDTVAYRVDFSNLGERSAADVYITDFIDYSGMSEGTEYVDGSVSSSLPGRLEYYDILSGGWVEVAPPAPRIKGIRLFLETLLPAAGGSISFLVRVSEEHDYGNLFNAAAADYRGGDARPYQLNSNQVSVLVGRLSLLSLGPAGNPAAPSGTLEDRVLISLNGSDTSYTFWHEVLNDGNFTDTLEIVLADSTVIPPEWNFDFVDRSGVAFPPFSDNAARLGQVCRDSTLTVGLRLRAAAERFRDFPGRELAFNLEARSLVDPQSRDMVQDVLAKTDIPLLSVKQSIREPNALIGDILSYIITVENLTAGTTVDSLLLVEKLSPGLGFAGGSDQPVIRGNTLSWQMGSIEPGQKREVIFRARVKAGAERGELVSSAWVYGVSSLGERTSDGPALAKIRIIEGIFTRRGIIFGSVFVDANRTGYREEDEKGVPGVSVFIEDGTYVVTDSSGMYSIPGAEEGTHLVRIDPKTLPERYIAESSGYFGFGVAGEALIDLAPSGNRRVDFPLSSSIIDIEGEDSAAIGGSIPAVADSSGLDDKPEGGGGVPPGRREDPSSIGAIVNTIGVSAPKRREPGLSGLAPAGRDAGESVDEESSPENGPEGSGSFEALTIPSSFFEAGSAVLEEIPLREVAALSLWLREHEGWKISISGHTDSVPISTAEFPSNFELSLQRARSTFQLLRMNGIPAARMEYTGYGSRRPLAPNSTAEGRALNRRVEINVVPPEGYASGDPGLPEQLSLPDTTLREYRLADEAGICADIVTPPEGRVFKTRDKIEVEVVSPLGSNVELYVNNIPVGREKIGQKQVDIHRGTLSFIFYNVEIKPGGNSILVVCRKRGERNVCVRNVYLAGNPAALAAERGEISVPADGKSAPEVIFLVNDKFGLPVRDGVFLDVTGPRDLIEGVDVNPHRSGIQAVTTGGRVVLKMKPSAHARREKVNVAWGELSGGC